MSLKHTVAIIFLFSIALTACKDEPEITAPIIGKWSGQESDFKINPSGIIPAFTLHEDEFPVQLEFKTDGSLILTDNKGVNRNGSYVHSGDQLTINVDYTFELIELSGTYQINELTSSSLQTEIEKEGSYTHPDTGQQFDGKVTATLYFRKNLN
jgi:hypothetical protein